METKHTKGEWFYFKNNNYKCIRTIEQELITEYNGTEANAKLISAAPELLASLVNLLKWSAHFPEAMNDEIIQAKNAIKKATE